MNEQPRRYHPAILMSSVEIVYGSSSPILVIGMHRSGTRLVANVLNELGVFMGADQQADAESVTFMLLNETILHQCGAFWSEPMAAHFILSDPNAVSQLAALTAESLDRELDAYRGAPGPAAQEAAEQTRPFGWKDPRNTFTLPVWRKLFPALRVIHVLRHGVDVAASLSRRHGEALRSATGEATPNALTVVQDDMLGVLSSRRGWNLSEALTMWEQYVEKARLEAGESGESSLEIRFEKLVEQPEQCIADIAEFCSVPNVIEGSGFVDRINADRCYAYRQVPELLQFAESERAVLDRYGYAP